MQKDLEYLYFLRTYIAAISIIFILSLIFGFQESARNPGSAEDFIKMFENLVNWIKTIDPPVLQMFVLLLVIFINNALKSLAVIILGVGFGIFPLYLVAYNGEAVGMVAEMFSRQKGILYVLAALLPHGIIEIPMILISAGIGLRLGHVVLLSLMGAKTELKQELKQSLRFYLKRIAPLLFVAAVIETFITSSIVAILMAG